VRRTAAWPDLIEETDMIADLRSRGQELRELLDHLDGLLAAKEAPSLPGVLVAELLLAVDRSGKRLQKLTDQLAAVASRNGQDAARDPEGDATP
jgi:hypothetical protein